MDIIETLRPHLKFIYHRTYYRFRDKAIEALGNLLWGFRSKNLERRNDGVA